MKKYVYFDKNSNVSIQELFEMFLFDYYQKERC